MQVSFELMHTLLYGPNIELVIDSFNYSSIIIYELSPQVILVPTPPLPP
jgi:hypothetical protein